ncbi:MAG: di-trans,poly-cis-decaprenylcistransferase [Treponema sp.]|jgi:undecaprenyl diphosphate synthase|nr:di-trans,poly-cis-decaprenylcistransferase [Treponema sp.]
MSVENDGTDGKIPVHIGIIMDGNGRWAKQRGLPRTAGHLEGLKTAKRMVKEASDRGVKYLSLYVFSTENWKRASEEVSFILGLVKQYLLKEMDFSRENRIRVRHAGSMAGLPEDVAEEIRKACAETKDFTGMQVILALNYGGRDEIVRAVNRALKEVNGKAEVSAGPSAAGCLTEETVRNFLDNPDIPDPDLVIRTAGEFRISNFLLWEGAYAEYYSSPKFWPDWTGDDLDEAIGNYGKRERRFGGVKKGRT